MRKGDVQCPRCSAGFRRIELVSMRGEPDEYRCPVCDARLEKMSGNTYVAYRLTVPPESALSARDMTL
jgi:transposase-like protein